MDAARMAKWLESMRKGCQDEYALLNDPKNRMGDEHTANDEECDDERMIEIQAEIRLLDTILDVVRRAK